MTPLAPLVTSFFRSHLVADKGVSKNTVASYSYAFKFLCRFASERLDKTPSSLFLEDLDARRSATTWSISNETAAMARERETYV